METIIYPTSTATPPPPPPLHRYSNSRRLLLFSLTLTSLLLFAATAYFSRHQPLLTPLATTTKILELNLKSQHKPTKTVYGFLPYWNYKYYQDLPYHLLSHLAIFGAGVNPDGTFQRREADYTEPGWRALQLPATTTIRRYTTASHTKLILVLRAFDNDIIDTLIADPAAISTLIGEIQSISAQKSFDGINIDFEYVGEVDSVTRDQFTQFVTTLHRSLKSDRPDFEISIDVYADSADKPRLWDLDALASVTDYTIIMAYDFHRPSSKTAGPVAPLYGGTSHWEHDITTLLAQHSHQTPSNQIILGVPFYGYGWDTQSDQFLSSTLKGSGSMATYRSIRDLLSTSPASVSAHWDEISLTPWLCYQTDDSTTRQIYYDDDRSLGYKYDLVNQSDLAGIAIWALGYETPYQEPWHLVQAKFPPRQ